VAWQGDDEPLVTVAVSCGLNLAEDHGDALSYGY
jgi:hypothetical protein